VFLVAAAYGAVVAVGLYRIGQAAADAAMRGIDFIAGPAANVRFLGHRLVGDAPANVRVLGVVSHSVQFPAADACLLRSCPDAVLEAAADMGVLGILLDGMLFAATNVRLLRSVLDLVVLAPANRRVRGALADLIVLAAADVAIVGLDEILLDAARRGFAVLIVVVIEDVVERAPPAITAPNTPDSTPLPGSRLV